MKLSINLFNSFRVQSLMRYTGFKSWLGLKPAVIGWVVDGANLETWTGAGARIVLHLAKITKFSDLIFSTFVKQSSDSASCSVINSVSP